MGARAENIGVALTAGSSADAKMVQVSLISNRGFYSTRLGSEYKVSAHLESTLAALKGKKSNEDSSFLVVGITPVLRFEPASSAVYFEAGIGANYFQQRRIHDTKSMGTRFEFGDLIGFGVYLGEKKQVELGYRFTHYSNASISTENPGLNFHQIRVETVF